MTLPSLIFITAFALYPLFWLVWIATHEGSLMRPRADDFLWLENIKSVVTSYYFNQAMGITAIFTVLVLATLIPFGLGTALLLNSDGWLSRLGNAALVIPWAVPTTVAAILWKLILDGNFGALNGLLYSVGAIDTYRSWLADPQSAMISLTVAHLWKTGPFVTIVLLASLQAIPRELWDAVRVDGGDYRQYIRHMVLPILRPTLTIVLIFESIVAMVTFDLIFVLTGGGPANSTATLAWFGYAETFKFLDIGAGAAVGILLTVFVLLLSLLYLKLLRTDTMESYR